jgi:hypothetical protein
VASQKEKKMDTMDTPLVCHGWNCMCVLGKECKDSLFET